MAIKLPDGRIMRTLPEQVDKNMQDIASINNEVNVIKESITTAYKIQGSATVADLNANTPDAAMNGYVYNMTDAGSLINSDETTTAVQIGDNVVLVWNEGNYFWDRLSGVVDTSNLVTLDSDQEITGSKTFTQTITSSTGNDIISYSLGSYFIKLDGNGQPNIGQNNNDIRFYGSNIRVSSPVLRPQNNRATDLGDDSYSFNEAHIKELIFPAGETSYISVGGSHELSLNTTNLLCDVHVLPWGNNLFNLGEPTNGWRNLFLTNTIQFKNPDAGRYWRIYEDSTQNLILSSSTSGETYSNVAFFSASGNLNLLSHDLITAGNISNGQGINIPVADIIRKRLTVSYNVSVATSSGISMMNLTLSADDLAKLDSTKSLIIANNSTSSAVISAVYLPALSLFTVLAYQTQGNASLDFDIYQ